MKIFLVRHGETTSDVEDRYGGDYDDHLTAKGREQSQELAGRLKDSGIQKIFSSPRFRAMETAEILSKELDVGVEPVESIRERNFYGILTGMKKEEAARKYPRLIEKLEDHRNAIEKAESYGHFRERVLRAFLDIAASQLDVIAIVTHGGPISCIFREVFHREFERMGDCALFEIEAGKKMKLARYERAEFK